MAISNKTMRLGILKNMKLVAIVQDNNNGDIYHSMELNVNEFDVDNDGVVNRDDNCMFVSNPSQEDADGDDNGGDACDPCDNANIYVAGNTYGDYFIYDDDIELSYQVNIFDVFRLLEIIGGQRRRIAVTKLEI